jgi:hypothetical protein
MQKILRWTLLAFLLACVVGCNTHHGVIGGILFEVDGVEYKAQRYVNLDQNSRVVSSILTVGLPTQLRGCGTNFTSRGETIVTLHLDGGNEQTISKTHTLYFVQDGKIAFEKGFQELGIDESRLNADTDKILEYLRPILENLIREHVQPQEAEREGQEP